MERALFLKPYRINHRPLSFMLQPHFNSFQIQSVDKEAFGYKTKQTGLFQKQTQSIRLRTSFPIRTIKEPFKQTINNHTLIKRENSFTPKSLLQKDLEEEKETRNVKNNFAILASQINNSSMNKPQQIFIERIYPKEDRESPNELETGKLPDLNSQMFELIRRRFRKHVRKQNKLKYSAQQESQLIENLLKSQAFVQAQNKRILKEMNNPFCTNKNSGWFTAKNEVKLNWI
jgi:hypothetical protein